MLATLHMLKPLQMKWNLLQKPGALVLQKEPPHMWQKKWKRAKQLLP